VISLYGRLKQTRQLDTSTMSDGLTQLFNSFRRGRYTQITPLLPTKTLFANAIKDNDFTILGKIAGRKLNVTSNWHLQISYITYG
jgi:hypothetical protein